MSSNAESRVVLVVDDDEGLRTMISRALRPSYQVHEAHDGATALAILERIAAPYAIVCDVTMPGFDGFELGRRLKRSPKHRSVPIIFLTARTSGVDIVEAMKVGAAHYILKPFSVRELMDKLENLAPPAGAT
jgi:CheY-like chemotaxis protein